MATQMQTPARPSDESLLQEIAAEHASRMSRQISETAFQGARGVKDAVAPAPPAPRRKPIALSAVETPALQLPAEEPEAIEALQKIVAPFTARRKILHPSPAASIRPRRRIQSILTQIVIVLLSLAVAVMIAYGTGILPW